VNTAQRALTMGSLVLAGEVIYTLPYYLRRDYSQVFLAAADLTNTQLGTLSSMFGVFALLCYFPGGWLADRVSARKLLTVSLLSTGLGGIYLYTLPGYRELIALYAFWGVSSILTFWGALIKATRAWGGHGEQGRAFGILDGGRGVVGAILASVALATFATFDDTVAGLRTVIAIYAGAGLLAGVAVWLVVPEDETTTARDDDVGPSEPPLAKKGEHQLREVIRIRMVWLQAIVIFCAYSAYWGTFDLAAFAGDAFEMDEVSSAGLSTFGTWLRPVAAVSAGFIADKLSSGRTITFAFILLLATFLVFAVTPTGPSMVWLLWANTAALCAAAYALRGIYFALMEEGGIPVHLTGTAVGLVSILGYTPDIIVPLFSGHLLDTYSGATGHKIFFGCLAALCAVGLVAAIFARREAVKTALRSAALLSSKPAR